MNRTRLAATVLALTCGALVPAGAAVAGDDGTPGPTPAAATATTNTVPVANPDTATVQAGHAITVPVLANDTDADAAPQPLSVAAVTDPSGRAQLVDGAVVFTARSADGGTKPTFSYTITDGQDTSAPATVTVTVTSPPPPPVRRVTIAMATQVVALRSYSIHGAVSQATPRPVDVAVQRLSAGRWVRYRTDRVGAGRTWAVPFRTDTPKRYVFRAVATWGDGKHASTGRLARTVVARPDVVVSGPLTRGSVPYSYRAGCPVPPSGLRRITINRFTYSHVVARGSLVVRASAVPDLTSVFRAAFAARFPVRSMKPTDAFYAGGSRTPTESDVAAMRADNTSAFNCRPVTGNPYRVSQHSYGNAIDINTVRNPYVVGSRVYPGFARTYLNRSDVRTGMITSRGVVATRMRQLGWPWGARWSHPDYQHFSSNGG